MLFSYISTEPEDLKAEQCPFDDDINVQIGIKNIRH
jgi:hypothetical protein